MYGTSLAYVDVLSKYNVITYMGHHPPLSFQEKPAHEEEPPYPSPPSRIFKLNAPEWPYLLFGSVAAVAQGSIWPMLAMFTSEILAVSSTWYYDMLIL